MKNSATKSIEVSADLFEEFEASCITDDPHASVKFHPTEEQAALIKGVFNRPDCDRLAFARKFKEKYGSGTVNTFKAWLQREGIELTKSARRMKKDGKKG